MQKNEVTTRMPRREAHMMVTAILGQEQARKRREAVGRLGQPFVKVGEVKVEQRREKKLAP